MTTPPNGTVDTRSAIAAGVLGILLGGLGVHRFYLGYVGAGFAILCSVFLGILLSFLILPGLLAFAASILALVEGILLLTGSFDTVATGARLQR